MKFATVLALTATQALGFGLGYGHRGLTGPQFNEPQIGPGAGFGLGGGSNFGNGSLAGGLG